MTKKLCFYLFVATSFVVVAFITSQLGIAIAAKWVRADFSQLGGLKSTPHSYILRPTLSKVGLAEAGVDTNKDGSCDQWQVSVVQHDLAIVYKGHDFTSDGYPDEVKVLASRPGGLTDSLLVADRDGDGSPDLIEATLAYTGTSSSYVTYDDYDANGDWDAEYSFRNGEISQIRLRLGFAWRPVERVDNDQELTFRDKQEREITYVFRVGEWQSDKTLPPPS